MYLLIQTNKFNCEVLVISVKFINIIKVTKRLKLKEHFLVN